MKIVHVETVVSCGPYAESKHWRETRRSLHASVKKCAWPPGSKTFTIHPQSGKKRGEGNGVGPIKLEFIKELRKRGWTIEGAAKNHLGQDLGDFDAILLGPEGPIVAEWETGNISSSHRSMNKLTMLVSDGVIAAWNGCSVKDCVSNFCGGQYPAIDARRWMVAPALWYKVWSNG